MDLGKVGYQVYLDDAAYLKMLQKMRGDTENTGATLGRVMTKLGGVIAAAFSFREAIRQSRMLSKEIANIKSIAFELDGEKIRTQLTGVDAALGNTANLANALYFAYSAGVRGTERELVNFTATVAGLAKATGSEVTPVMDAITTMMNAYGLSVKDAGRLSDWFYQIIKSGKTTGPELAHSLGMIAASAASSKIEIDDLGAAIAVLTTTMPTAQAVTSLNQAIMAFTKPTDDARQMADALGFSMSAAELQARGFAGMMDLIHQKAKGDVAVITKLFGSVDALKAALALTGGQYNQFNATLDEFASKGGNAKKALDEVLSSDDANFERMVTIMQKVAASVGKLFFHVVTLNGALNGFYSWMGKFSAQDYSVIAKIIGMTAAVWGLSKAGKAVQSVASIFSLMAERGAAMAAAQNAVAASTVAVDTAMTAVPGKIGRIRNAVRGLWASISAHPILLILTVAAAAWTAISSYLDRAREKAEKNLELARDAKNESAESYQRGQESRSVDLKKMERLQQLALKQKLTNGEMAEAKTLAGELGIKYETLGGKIQLVGDKLLLAANAMSQLMDAMKIQAIKELDIQIEKRQNVLSTLRDQMEEQVKTKGFSWSYWNEFLLMSDDEATQAAAGRMAESQKEWEKEYSALADLKRKRDAIAGGSQSPTSGEESTKEEKSIRRLDIDRKKRENSLLESRIRFSSFGGMSAEDTDAFTRQEIANLQADLANAELKVKNAANEDDKIDAERAVLELRSSIIDKENALAERQESARRIALESARKIAFQDASNMANADGFIDSDEKISLKNLEIAQSEARLDELARRISESTDSAVLDSLKLEQSTESGKLLSLQNERAVLSASTDAVAEAARSTAFKQARLDAMSDGDLSDADKASLKDLERDQQAERVAELEQKAAMDLPDELARQITDALLDAKLKLADLSSEYTGTQAKRNPGEERTAASTFGAAAVRYLADVNIAQSQLDIQKNIWRKMSKSKGIVLT